MSDLPLEDTSLILDPQAGLPDPVLEVTQDAVRLCQVYGTVLKLSHYDGNPIDMSNCTLSGENVVPISDDSGNVLGSAFIRLEDDALIAEGTIDFSSPERLSLENGDKFYFIMNGDTIVTGGDKWRPMRGSEIRVKNIVLTQFLPTDPRVESVKFNL